MPGAGDKDLIAPRLAELTRQGVQFSRRMPPIRVCTPLRATLQTGRYPHAVSMPWNNRQLPVEETCVAEAFAAAGYKTGYIGKWHLDGDAKPGFVPPGPRRRGYQYWAGFNRGHAYFNSVDFRDEDKPLDGAGFEPIIKPDSPSILFARIRRRLFFCSFPTGRRTRHANHPSVTPPPINLPRSTLVRMCRPPTQAQARKGMAGYYGLCTSLDENVDDGPIRWRNCGWASRPSLSLRQTTETCWAARDWSTRVSGTRSPPEFRCSSGGRDAWPRVQPRTGCSTIWTSRPPSAACAVGDQSKRRTARTFGADSGRRYRKRPESIYVQGSLGTAGSGAWSSADGISWWSIAT